MTSRFDLIIIGGGPAGYELAARAAAEGRAVCLFERSEPGGTCLNRGCIPTKALCRAAEVMRTAREAGDFGIVCDAPGVDMRAVMARKDAVVSSLREGVCRLLEGVTLIRGEARFSSASVVECDGTRYEAPEIVVATGSRPSRLTIPGAEYAVTSDELLSINELPESLAIIGGGVIGMEFASIFSAFGSKVTVLEYCPEILPPFDAEIAKRLRMSIKRAGVDVVTGAGVTAIAEDGTVSFTVKGKPKNLRASVVLMATGRVPIIPEGLVEAGALLHRNALDVNALTFEVKWREGSAPEGVKVYGVGDVNGICMLAHAATAQALSLLGKRFNLDVVPGVVFTSPEVAMAGLTEQQALDKGLDIRVLRSTFAANGKAVTMGETAGMVKLIVDAAAGTLLGAHICGPHASDLIQEAAVLTANGLSIDCLTRTIHPHPTLSEVVASAR